MRKCFCDNVKYNQPYDISQCRLCWLYHHNEKYRKMWDTEKPNLFKKIKSFIKSFLKHWWAGSPEVSKRKFKQRMNICRGCEFYNKSGNSCNKCGCNLSVKAKWKTQKCPINKW